MIFQEPMTSLNPVLTCGYQVAETIRRHQQKILDKQQVRKAVETLFEEVGLPAPSRIYGSYPHQLSGGQKQRVMIAMALSCNPELLIADEPTTALDATAQKLILELLLQVVRRRNMSMIFISHDLDVIGRVADRVLVMKNGQLIEAGTVHEVLNHPKEAYTKALIASRPVMGQKLAKLPVPENFTGDQPEPLHKLFTTPEIDARLNRLYSHKPLICVQDLQTWYPVNRGLFSRNKEYVKAVDTVSFDIYPGEVAGLVGESGCGKTTLGRSILRLVEPTAGSVLWKGQNILDFTKREMNRHRTCMQIMFQDPYSSLNPAMTVGESITEPMRFHGLFGNKRQQKERAAWLLEKVMMQADHADRYPHEFSGGQRQRISIARALALQPEFIVCDETVSALDVSVQAQVLNLLRDLQQEFNLTYLFISHDLSVVHHFCDKILVMNKGRIEETGAASQVLSAPSSEYTRRLLEAAS
jgi:peptide/nickel transport system ATP-binding protein